MAQARYAPSGISVSWKGSLFSATVLGLAALLSLPALASDGHRAAAAAPAPAPTAGQEQQALAAKIAAAPGAQWAGQIEIHPSAISTSQPGITVQPVRDNLIGPAGDMSALGIPTMVLQAYHQSANDLGRELPSCHLPWWLLAGIGHTESGHAESGRLTADGTTRGKILGPPLNGGIVGDAVITDTDHGALDGDPVYDRAVGPMQFIPSTWRTWGADGNHDGVKDPSNIFDATLAAGRYLCADGRNLATKAGIDAAVLSYNHSQAYLDTVLAWGLAYRSGASSVPDSTAPVISDVTKVRPKKDTKPPKPTRKVPPSASATPKPGSTHPSASPTATATTSAPASSSPTASPSPTCTTTSGTPTATSTPPSPTGTASKQSGAAAGAVPGRTSASAGSSAARASATAGGSSSARPSRTGSSTPTATPTGCGH